MQYRWPVLFFDYWGRIFLGLLFCPLSRSKPRPFRNPRTIQLAGLCDGENSLRHARVKSFVNDSEIESHGNGGSLIGIRIVKFPVHHDGDGNEAGFSLARQLNQTKSARSLIDLNLLA